MSIVPPILQTVSRSVPIGLMVLLVAAPTAHGESREVAPVRAGLFDAIDQGHVDVQFIPLNASKANVVVANLTDKPVHLEMPTAFAGVPAILGQGLGGGGFGGGGGLGGGGGGGQAVGGGLGGGGAVLAVAAWEVEEVASCVSRRNGSRSLLWIPFASNMESQSRDRKWIT